MEKRTQKQVINLKFIGLLIIFMLSATITRAQLHQDFMPIEKAILETVVRDTVSKTYFQLPLGLTLGLGKKWGGYWIVAKSGKKNFLLLNGTPFVYSIITDSKGIGITRVDQEIHRGDNFSRMAFFRKDTLLEVGGYGFWKVRDHFSYYNETQKRWQPLKSNNRLPFEKLHHYYDARDDRFYLFGQLLSDNKKNSSEKMFSDSIFRFSFSTGAWETLGKIEPGQWATLEDPSSNLSNIFHTPFGLGGTFHGSIILRDPEKNQWYAARDSVKVSTSNYFDDLDSVFYSYRVFIYLNDSLHLFFGDAKTFTHGKIGLTRSDFEKKPSGRLYIPLEKPDEVPTNQKTIFSLIVGASALGIFITFWQRNKKSKVKRAGSMPTDHEITHVIHPETLTDKALTPDNRSDFDTFLSSLSTGEKALVEKLYVLTLQGNPVDIDSINKILGVGRKEMSVQKTRRSMAISKINGAYSICLKLKNPLIVRMRDEADKRSYTYRIAEEHLDRVGKYLA